jgi:hypothetical protein
MISWCGSFDPKQQWAIAPQAPLSGILTLSQTQQILDYASPRPRGRVRLPAESHIEIQADRDSTTVTESLKGRSTAIAAIGFAIFVLIVLLCVIVSLVQDWYVHPGNGLVEPVFMSIVWLAEATLGVFVLDQTYRRTVLRVRDGELTLIFSALFSRTRQHCWPIEEIGELRVELTQSGPDAASLAELQIRPAHDVCVHLFTDHRELDVQHIAAVIVNALNGEHELPAAREPKISAPDEAVFNLLLKKTRALRQSDQSKHIAE